MLIPIISLAAAIGCLFLRRKTSDEEKKNLNLIGFILLSGIFIGSLIILIIK